MLHHNIVLNKGWYSARVCSGSWRTPGPNRTCTRSRSTRLAPRAEPSTSPGHSASGSRPATALDPRGDAPRSRRLRTPPPGRTAAGLRRAIIPQVPVSRQSFRILWWWGCCRRGRVPLRSTNRQASRRWSRWDCCTRGSTPDTKSGHWGRKNVIQSSFRWIQIDSLLENSDNLGLQRGIEIDCN